MNESKTLFKAIPLAIVFWGNIWVFMLKHRVAAELLDYCTQPKCVFSSSSSGLRLN